MNLTTCVEVFLSGSKAQTKSAVHGIFSVIPHLDAGSSLSEIWIPAFAGMTPLARAQGQFENSPEALLEQL